MDTRSTTRGPLVASLSGVLKNGAGLLLARLELAALELSDARRHALALLGVCALALLAIAFAVGFGAALVVVLSWEALGWKILLILLLLFAVLAALLVRKANAMLAQDKLALPATMQAFQTDREMLL